MIDDIIQVQVTSPEAVEVILVGRAGTAGTSGYSGYSGRSGYSGAKAQIRRSKEVQFFEIWKPSGPAREYLIPRERFNKTEYQREYMREYRAGKLQLNASSRGSE